MEDDDESVEETLHRLNQQDVIMVAVSPYEHTVEYEDGSTVSHRSDGSISIREP